LQLVLRVESISVRPPGPAEWNVKKGGSAFGVVPVPRFLTIVCKTGEGTVDATTLRGKAPGAVARRCSAAGVRCVVFGGRVDVAVPGVETVDLSGDPARAREDLRELRARIGAP